MRHQSPCTTLPLPRSRGRFRPIGRCRRFSTRKARRCDRDPSARPLEAGSGQMYQAIVRKSSGVRHAPRNQRVPGAGAPLVLTSRVSGELLTRTLEASTRQMPFHAMSSSPRAWIWSVGAHFRNRRNRLARPTGFEPVTYGSGGRALDRDNPSVSKEIRCSISRQET